MRRRLHRNYEFPDRGLGNHKASELRPLNEMLCPRGYGLRACVFVIALILTQQTIGFRGNLNKTNDFAPALQFTSLCQLCRVFVLRFLEEICLKQVKSLRRFRFLKVEFAVR